MTIRTMIVDDEPLAVERLQMLCVREPRLALVGTATNGEAALRLVEGLRPDLLMLDIAMPLLDGIGVARAVGKLGIRPAVIFVTAFEGFAVEAFDLAAIDYLLKPVAHDRLTRAIDRVEQALGNRADAEPPPPHARPRIRMGRGILGSPPLGAGPHRHRPDRPHRG